MRNVFFQMMVSLDGYMDGPKGAWDIDWHLADDDFNRYSMETLGAIDAILMGRVTYEGFVNYWPTSADPEAAAMNALPKVVFSSTLDKVEWNNARLVRGDAAAEVARMKAEAGKDMAIFSNRLATSLAAHGLIDEYRFFVNPVVLGGGTPILSGIKEQLNLKLVKTDAFGSGVVALHYRPS
jgi:dihydrofolate reductase